MHRVLRSSHSNVEGRQNASQYRWLFVKNLVNSGWLSWDFMQYLNISMYISTHISTYPQYLCDGAEDCSDGYDEDARLCTAARRPPVEETANFLYNLLVTHGYWHWHPHYCSHTIHLVSLMVDQDFEEAVKLILILQRIEMTITTKVDNNIINTETCYICHRTVIEC